MITWIGGQGFRNNVSDKVSEIIDQDVSFGEFSLKGLNLRSKGLKIDKFSMYSMLACPWYMKVCRTPIKKLMLNMNNIYEENI